MARLLQIRFCAVLALVFMQKINRTDPVLDWNSLMISAIRADNSESVTNAIASFQASSDLRKWSSVVTNTAAVGGFLCADRMPATTPRQFYRVLELGP